MLSALLIQNCTVRIKYVGNPELELHPYEIIISSELIEGNEFIIHLDMDQAKKIFKNA